MLRLVFCVLLACLPACTKENDQQTVNLPDITRWAQPNVDLVSLLTSEPDGCLKLPEQQKTRHQILLGRAAFRSPYLLGGQAARKGFSCNACHTNGDINKHFFVAGMSSEPGTADVTNFHFSKTLGDNTFNPKPIPSLVKLAVPETSEQVVAREEFVLRLIEKEFDGDAPSDQIKASLLAYVEALDEKACKVDGMSGRELLTHRLDLVDKLIELLVDNNDSNTQDFLKASLRAELGRLYSRFPRAEALRDKLTNLSKGIRLEDMQNLQTISSQWLDIREGALANYNSSLFAPSFVQQYFLID